ncbi:hypothetical protein HYW32_01605 [Candidatus Berkelbacteria bacterium]|nr:hypothetical protein [Candidatus Berkelbacteria bacterium]
MDDILYLEADEEITSVVDKLKNLPGKQIALVLPKRAQLISSIVNLKLLKREAERLKKSISIVTHDKHGTGLALQVGIPVYASVGDDQPISAPRMPKPAVDDVIDLDDRPQTEDEVVGPAPVPVKRYDASTSNIKTPAPAHPKPTPLGSKPSSIAPSQRSGWMQKLVGASLLLAVTLAGIWFFVFYPRAILILGVQSDPLTDTASIVVDNNIDAIQSDTGHIPGQKVQVETTVKEVFETTGNKEVGAKATGTVLISNRLGETVTVPSGATLSRDGLQFATLDEATVSAATVSLDISGDVTVKPGKATARVEASVVGGQFNLDAGSFTLTSFSGTKQEKVTAENTQAFTGGESRTVKVVTEQDIEAARTSIGEKSKDNLSDQLKREAKEMTVLADAIDVSVVSAQSSKAANDEADNFELEAKVRARSIGFRVAEYQGMVLALIGKKLPPDKELVVTQEDSMETEIESKQYDQGLLALKGTLKTEVAQKIDETALKELVAGKTSIQAEQILKDQPGITQARVQIRPAFRGSIPRSVTQIKLERAREHN